MIKKVEGSRKRGTPWLGAKDMEGIIHKLLISYLLMTNDTSGGRIKKKQRAFNPTRLNESEKSSPLDEK